LANRGRVRAIVGLAALLAGCAGDSLSVPSVTRLDELPERTEVASAPTQVEFASRTFTLETYLWRDFMPPIGPEGSPLMAVVRIVVSDGGPFPEELDADLLYVVNGDEVWVTTFSSESRPPAGSGVLEKVARGGPEWGPDIAVDVVVRLVDGNGPVGYLRATDQPIQATY